MDSRGTPLAASPCSSRPRGRYSVKYMVVKQAAPPTSWDTASAANTPVVPIQRGRMRVRGALTAALRSREKKMDCLARPSPTKAPWAAI